VLPSREFDLPSLRAMDANAPVDVDEPDRGSALIEPLKPLRTHLVLGGGVLTLRELEARAGQGRLFGTVQLDGRSAPALWTAELRWNGVRMRLVGGAISHLAVEAVGLDVAQALGVLVRGDDALPVDCTVADLVADQGVLKPRVLVLDTPDSTLWIDGSLSLATEALNLRIGAKPKDLSPLALRAPIEVRGTGSHSWPPAPSQLSAAGSSSAVPTTCTGANSSRAAIRFSRITGLSSTTKALRADMSGLDGRAADGDRGGADPSPGPAPLCRRGKVTAVTDCFPEPALLQTGNAPKPCRTRPTARAAL
jgi:uncharacterized protein involved in outer membrane biogenesis